MNDPDRPAGTCGFPLGKELYTEAARVAESRGDIRISSLPRYFGDTYCCPACGTAFSLIRAEITGYVKLRGEAREHESLSGSVAQTGERRNCERSP